MNLGKDPREEEGFLLFIQVGEIQPTGIQHCDPKLFLGQSERKVYENWISKSINSHFAPSKGRWDKVTPCGLQAP